MQGNIKASDCDLDYAKIVARTHPPLAEVMSFVQVEDGLLELQANWDGFVDTSDHQGCTFKTKRKACIEFGNLLGEYLKCKQSCL